jgi:hypothetical protein
VGEFTNVILYRIYDLVEIMLRCPKKTHHPGFDLLSSWPLTSDLLDRQNFASKNQRFAEGKSLFRASPEGKDSRSETLILPWAKSKPG